MFSAAITFMTDYRIHRAQSHLNLVAQSWFSESGEATTMDEVMAVFDSDTENAAWSKLAVTQNADFMKLQAVRTQIAFLAGCRHDLRNQYAIGMDNEPKTPLDFVRHACNETLAAQYQTSMLQQIVQAKAQGAS